MVSQKRVLNHVGQGCQKAWLVHPGTFDLGGARRAGVKGKESNSSRSRVVWHSAAFYVI